MYAKPHEKCDSKQHKGCVCIVKGDVCHEIRNKTDIAALKSQFCYKYTPKNRSVHIGWTERKST